MENPISNACVPFTNKYGRILTAQERATRRWLLKHPEKPREYRRKYVEAHKEEIRKKELEKVTCGCGLVLSRTNLSTHKKSQRHQKWMQEHQL